MEKVDCYFVRDPADGGFGWGYFIVTPNGLLVAYTDYGTYGYRWGSIGSQTVKEFLIKLRDPSYLLGKFSQCNWVDETKTRKAFKEALLRMRREGEIGKGRARELHEGLKNSDTDEMVRWALEQREFYDREGYGLICQDYPPAAKSFVERLFPLFQAELRKELEAATVLA